MDTANCAMENQSTKEHNMVKCSMHGCDINICGCERKPLTVATPRTVEADSSRAPLICYASLVAGWSRQAIEHRKVAYRLREERDIDAAIAMEAGAQAYDECAKQLARWAETQNDRTHVQSPRTETTNEGA